MCSYDSDKFHKFMDLVLKHFGIEYADIDLNTTLDDLDIEVEDFIDFLVKHRAEVEEIYIKMVDEPQLWLDIHKDKSISRSCDVIF